MDQPSMQSMKKQKQFKDVVGGLEEVALDQPTMSSMAEQEESKDGLAS